MKRNNEQADFPRLLLRPNGFRPNIHHSFETYKIPGVLYFSFIYLFLFFNRIFRKRMKKKKTGSFYRPFSAYRPLAITRITGLGTKLIEKLPIEMLQNAECRTSFKFIYYTDISCSEIFDRRH